MDNEIKMIVIKCSVIKVYILIWKKQTADNLKKQGIEE
jgi:hypothetical protein